jgi:hypothetical protein
MDLYYICVIGSVQNLSIWKNKNLIVEFVENIRELRAGCAYDYVFISTPVCWLTDGKFDDSELENNVNVARENGYSQEIILISTLPIGVAGKLGCHYLPIQQHYLSFFTNTPLLFGCHEKILIDQKMIYNLVSTMFGTMNISLYYTDSVEMIFLITLCQNYINQSFYKEMSHFCSKNKIRIDFQSMSWIFYQDMTPILIYMIQQMEEAKLDCPILYSCLFRQHYIDIPI